MHVFIDSSVLPKSVGFGSYLVLDSIDLTNPIDPNSIKSRIQTIKLNSTTSTDAELELAIYVLTNIADIKYLYTDCNNLYSLTSRNIKNTNRNLDKYNSIIELLKGIELIKVKGHKKKDLQVNNYDKIFSYVDKQARQTLRNYRST